MACKPKPQLRMADGGELMRRFANRQPVRMPAAGQRTQTFMPTMGNIQTEAFDPHIRQLALRDGGTVPGKGSGDKIPALYEPGEFVVSNDMLDAEPGLREQLHDLRGDVLAAKGKTVAEADAQAVKGGTLRAQYGKEDNDPFIATGNKYGQPQTALAGAQPGNPAGSGNAPGVSGAVPGVSGLPQRTAGTELSIKDRLRAAIPNTANVADQSVGDATRSWKNGRFGEAAGHMLRGVAASVPAFIHDEYNGLGPKVINPVEDAGRALFGMDARKEPSATPAPAAPAPLRAAQPAAKPVAAPAPAVAPGLQAVTPEDHATSDRLINSALYNRPRTGMIPGGVDQNGLKYGETWDEGNMNTLRTDGSSLKKYNAGLAARGAGIQVTKDANGQLRLSNSTGPEKMRYVGTDGVPTNQYERTNQYTEGQQQLAAARASLRNPDGSQWSARDNAIMAANLRDGVDPYHGTSRAPKNDEHAQVRALASSPVGTIGRRGAMRRMAEIEQNQTTQRGQDQDMERGRLTAQSTLRKNEFDMNRDIRKDAREQETHDQTVGDKAREGIAKEFVVYDTNKNGERVPNQEASTASLDALRSILPGMTSTDPKTREAALSDAKAMHGIFIRARNQDPVGWEAMKFWQPKRPALSGMPDATNGSVRQLSGLDGMLTLKAQNGDTLLRQKDGREINLGPLDARQRKLLEDAQQRGWGK